MAEYIDREAVLKSLKEKVEPYYADVDWFFRHAPTVDAEPVKHGHWIWKRRPIGGFRRYTGVEDMSGEERTVTVNEHHETIINYCSECGKRGDDTFFNYCPNCGAKMDGEGGEENARN